MTAIPSRAHYQAHLDKRQRVSKLIREQSEALEVVGVPHWHETLTKLRERVQADNFKVLVLGEFKRGKSTFINSLLGQEILPAYARPCTAIINEVKWGDEPKAYLHFVKKQGEARRKPMKIPVEQLEEYVVIQQDQGDTKSPYEKVELFWPLELCRHGVEIIDSPGLNESELREQITMSYLASVDAILFVMSCSALASKSELQVINSILLPSGHEDIFFVCNRFDDISRRERGDIREYGYRHLAGLTKRGESRVFFISARNALEGRLDDDHHQVQKSGVEEVEQELESFLAQERGRLKIFRAASEQRRIIREARLRIPAQEKMLRSSLETLKKQFGEAEEPLRDLDADRLHMVQRIERFIHDTRIMVTDRAQRYFHSLEDEVESWVEGYEIEHPVRFFSYKTTLTQAREVAEEVGGFLSERSQEHLLAWQNQELRPFLDERLESFMNELDQQAQQFVRDIDDLRREIAASVWGEDEEASGLARILATSGESPDHNLGAANIGVATGYQQILADLVPQIAIGVITVVLAGFNPLVLIPALLGAGFLQSLISIESTHNKIKAAIGEKFQEDLRQSAGQRSKNLTESVTRSLAEFKQAVDKGLKREVAGIREQFQSAIRQRTKGKKAVDENLNALAEATHKLNLIEEQVDALIEEVMLAG